MRDYSNIIVEDIKFALFEDGGIDASFKFVTWVGDGHSFIVQDDDGQEYRITVTREEQ